MPWSETVHFCPLPSLTQTPLKNLAGCLEEGFPRLKIKLRLASRTLPYSSNKVPPQGYPAIRSTLLWLFSTNHMCGARALKARGQVANQNSCQGGPLSQLMSSLPGTGRACQTKGRVSSEISLPAVFTPEHSDLFPSW